MSEPPHAKMKPRKGKERPWQAPQAELRLITDHAPLPIAYFDRAGVCRYANQPYAVLFGLISVDLQGLATHQVLPAETRVHWEEAVSGAPVHYEYAHRTQDGATHHLEVSLVPHRAPGGEVLGCYALIRDVTEQRRAVAQTLQAEERLGLALEGSGLALWDLDVRRGTVYLSEAWAVMLGEPPGVTQTTLEELFALTHPIERDALREAAIGAIKGLQPAYHMEHRVRAADGEWRWIESRGRVVQRDGAGRALRMAGTNADITQRKLAEQRIQELATRDALTDLPNRMVFNDRLQQAVAGAQRGQRRPAVLFVDLDRFKAVNDSLGHPVGDALLAQIALRLSGVLRDEDTLARQGGDEFIVLIPHVDSQRDLLMLVERLLAALARAFYAEGHELYVTGSIGVALYPDDGLEAATLLKHADTAMYHAKDIGGNNVQFFAPRMNELVQTRLALENRLRVALSEGELTVHYQPRIDLATGKVVGVEALARWRHPEWGWVAPGEFIRAAEESRLIVALGERVLMESCRQMKRWQELGRAPPSVAVNVSAREFREKGFLERLRRVLAETGLSPASLELKITESAIMKDAKETIALLRNLNDMGIELAVDDFGTGYSSLSYLKRFPIHRLKIDRSFVRDVATDAADAAIVAAIIAMARSLGLRVVAEGVETEAQVDFLRRHECHEAQGYYFGRPMSANELGAALRRPATLPRAAG